MRRYLISAAIAAVLAVLALGGGTAQGAPSTQTKAAGYHPRLLQNNMYFRSKTASKALFGLPLTYNGGDDVFYPTMKPKDVIPAVRVTLYLPAGVKIMLSHFVVVRNKLGQFPKKELRWSYYHGRPTWVLHGLSVGLNASWQFTVNVPAGTTNLCVQALLVPLGVPHAPSQHEKACIQ